MAQSDNQSTSKPADVNTTVKLATSTDAVRSKKTRSDAVNQAKRSGSFKSVSAKSGSSKTISARSRAFKTVSAKVKKAKQPANLLLRDMDPDVVKVLKARARRAGRSLQQELHLALRRDVRRNFDEAVAISSSWRERFKGRDLPDSTELLREDRAR